MNETLGQYLRRKREAHLISIQELSHSTGISVAMINALEEDKFHLMPRPEVTVKCLKKYAAYVRLEKKDILNRYKTQCELHQHKEYCFPQLSVFSEGGKSSKQIRGMERLSRKQIIEGVFWIGIAVWALIIIYLYVHVMSLQKTGMLEMQEIITSKEVAQADSRQSNAPMPSATSDKSGNAPEHFSHESVRSGVAVPLERSAGMKELSSQAFSAQYSPGKAKVIGNRKSKLYHTHRMKYYHKVKLQNRVIFASETHAVKAGYRKAPE
jgi:cytoskeletal protein RodZ